MDVHSRGAEVFGDAAWRSITELDAELEGQIRRLKTEYEGYSMAQTMSELAASHRTADALKQAVKQRVWLWTIVGAFLEGSITIEDLAARVLNRLNGVG